MRLIDAEEVECLFNEQIEQGATDAFDAFDDALQDATTVDAEVVVRCKDCKWDRPDTLLDKHWCSRLLGCTEVRAGDFCSYGERKDGSDADW